MTKKMNLCFKSQLRIIQQNSNEIETSDILIKFSTMNEWKNTKMIVKNDFIHFSIFIQELYKLYKQKQKNDQDELSFIYENIINPMKNDHMKTFVLHQNELYWFTKKSNYAICIGSLNRPEPLSIDPELSDDPLLPPSLSSE
jgi:hypothetical protein